MSLTKVKALVFVDHDEWDDANTFAALKDAAYFTEKYLNNKGGIGGLPIELQLKKSPTKEPDLNAYLKHAEQTSEVFLYPYILSAVEEARLLTSFFQTESIFCLRLRDDVELPKNFVAHVYGPPKDLLKRILDIHDRSEAIVLSTRPLAVDVNDNCQIFDDKESATAFLDEINADLERGKPRTELIYVDSGWEILSHINKAKSLGANIITRAGADPLGYWLWFEDISPDIDLLTGLRATFSKHTAAAITATALEVNCFRWLFIFNQTCRDLDLTKQSSRINFQELILQSLQNIDGKNDVFLDGAGPKIFNGKALVSMAPFFIMKSVGQNAHYKSSDMTSSLLAEKQLPRHTSGEPVATIYVFCDVLRVSKVDIEARTWTAEIELECSGNSTDLIDLFNISNMAKSESTASSKLLTRAKIRDSFFTEKYLLNVTLSFDPEISMYPFDDQLVYLELESVDPNKYIIQPTPLELADDDFDIDGWSIIDSYAGVRNRKRVNRLGPELRREIEIIRQPTTQWLLRRRDSQLFVRSVVPLIFLSMLSWYSTFVGPDDLRNALALNTTAFLSSIALLFALNRPAVSQLTIIDQLFLTFHCAVGATTIGIMLSIQSKVFLEHAFPYLKYVIPAMLLIFATSLSLRLRARRS